MLLTLRVLTAAALSGCTLALVFWAWAAGYGALCPLIGAVGGWLTCSLAADEEEDCDA